MPETDRPDPDAAAIGSGKRAVLRTYFSDLFDLQFTNLITTRMMPGVYGLGIVLSALLTGYFTYQGFQKSTLEGFVWVFLLAPATFIGLVTTLRITLEFVLAVFRIAWHVELVAGSTKELSHHMPKFGFWRTLLYGERAAPSLKPQTGPSGPQRPGKE